MVSRTIKTIAILPVRGVSGEKKEIRGAKDASTRLEIETDRKTLKNQGIENTRKNYYKKRKAHMEAMIWDKMNVEETLRQAIERR